MKVYLDEDQNNYMETKETDDKDLFLINFKFKNEATNSNILISMKVKEEVLEKIITTTISTKARVR